MADNRNPGSGFKEAVCIDASKIYDTCCDRDCLEDLRCFFTPRGQEVIDQAINVRIKSSEVIQVFIDVEPVHFNRGYYACDLSFFFLVQLEAFVAPQTQPIPVEGVCFFDKKVILYGSEGSVKVFSNEFEQDGVLDNQLQMSGNMPRCIVECVDPVALEAHICEVRDCYHGRCMPSCVSRRLGGELDTCSTDKAVYCTLGLFTIVKLVRDVAMLIPVYDFCVPEKECDGNGPPADNACDMFSRLSFPFDDFFPPANGESGCGC